MQASDVHASQLEKKDLLGGAYCLKGADPFWLERAEKLFRSLLPSDSLSLRILDKVSGASEIVSAFDTLCFGDDITVVIVKDEELNMSDKDHALLTSFLKTTLEPNFLVFCNQAVLNAAETKLCNVVDCSPLDRFACMNVAEKLFPAGIEKNALKRLIELTGCDMQKIKNEAKKLNDYCDNTFVSEEDVENLVVEDTETTVFLFSNCIVEGQLSKAEKQLEKLLKRGEKPAVLLSILSNQFRRMLYCAVTPLDNKQMADLLGIKEFAVAKTRNIKGYGQSKLKAYSAMITDYEFKFKSGVLSDETAFKEVVSKLLTKEAL